MTVRQHTRGDKTPLGGASYGELRLPQTPKEALDVLPPPCLRMGLVIRTHLPHLGKPQATVLALWSLGIGLARSCALTAVSAFLVTWLGRTEPAVRQPLRAWGYETAAQRGTTRGTLAVELCFTPLLAWVVAQWEGPRPCL